MGMLARVRARLDAWAGPLTWVLLGAITLAAYVWGFTQPFNVETWIHVPELTLGKFTQWTPQAGWSYFAIFSVLFLLYWLAYQHALLNHGRSDWVLAAGFIVLFCVALAFTYPIDAADVFDGIMRGRMWAWYGANPFFRVPADFSHDNVYPYVAWRYIGSAYGPFWEQIAGVLARLGGKSVLDTVLVFKAGSIAAFGLCLALIAACLRRLAPERALSGVVLFGWCPLVLYTTAGGAHNDLYMVAAILLAAWFLIRQWYAPAVWALVAGVLIKFIPVMLLPLFALYVYRRMGLPPFRPAAADVRPGAMRWMDFARFALPAAAGAAALSAAGFLPFLSGGGSLPDMLAVQRRTEMLTSSAPALLQALLENYAHYDAGQAALLATRVALILLAGAGLVTTWQSAQRDVRAPLRAGRDLILFYLLVSCLWLQPWYIDWPLALAAILPEDRGTRATALLGYTLMCKALLFEYVLMPRGAGPEAATRELVVAPILLAPVWLYLAWGLLQRPRHTRAPQSPVEAAPAS